MLIPITDLRREPLELDLELAENAIDYTPDVRQIGPLKVEGRADLIEEHRGPRDTVDDIRLRARFSGTFEVQCARCLTPVREPLSGRFDLIFRPSDADHATGEHAITEDETEIGYYEKSGLLLEDAVREQVLLALPARTLCQQDCKGLCPECGIDRNTATCECADRPVDPRWNALAELGTPKA